MTRPVGLDFSAVMMTAQAAGVAGPMLAEILPRIESAIVNPPDELEEEADDDNP
jgi:hypothetical protein